MYGMSSVCPPGPLSTLLHLLCAPGVWPLQSSSPGPFCCPHLSWVQSVESASGIWEKERRKRLGYLFTVHLFILLKATPPGVTMCPFLQPHRSCLGASSCPPPLVPSDRTGCRRQRRSRRGRSRFWEISPGGRW